MRAALRGEPVTVRNPDAIRPWQHLLNPLSGYLLLAESLWARPEIAGAWNFGPDESDSRPVRVVVERLADAWPGGIDWRLESDDDSAREANYLKLDSSRARLRLGWLPQWDLDRALQAVVEWYAAYRDGADVRELSMAQVREHQAAPASAA